jgi:hypothetical protein
MYYIRLGALFLATCAVVACSAPAPDADSGQPTPSTGQPAILVSTDTATDPTVRQLEREAVALASTTGCQTADQCRSAPVGSRGCGGPRYHLPYCPLTTDTVALFAKLAEVARAEEDYNRRNQIGSTCELRMAPNLDLSGGACRARTTGPGSPR